MYCYNKFFLLFFLLSILTCYSQNKLITKKTPNIIFIFSDDHATNAISAYGGIYKDIAPTPNIDRIANEGALLTNALCTNAICGPSRAAILTGKYSHINGYYKNYKGGVFDSKQWTYPQALKKAGYQTALVGKWHLASEPVGFDYYKYHIAQGQQGLYWDPVYNDNGEKTKEKGYATNLTTDFAIDWLDVRDKNEPFCLLLQYKAPHREWSPDTKYEDLWSDIQMPYPKTFNDNYNGRELTAGNTEMTMDYLRTRRQFGSALSQFQVLQHRAVDMFINIEEVRSLVMNAAAKGWSDDPKERIRSVSAAKALTNRASRHVAQEAIQLHGGMGMTQELPLADYVRRLLSIDLMFGGERFQRQRFANADTQKVD